VPLVRKPVLSSIAFVAGTDGPVKTETVKELAKSFPAIKIRVGVRDKQAASEFEGLDNVTLIEADAEKPEELAHALKGSHSIFIIPPSHEKRVEHTKHYIQAATQSRLGFILLLSSPAALLSRENSRLSKEFAELESVVKETKTPYCFLRSEALLENQFWNPEVLTSEVFTSPAHPYARTNAISVRDVGAVAATVLATYANHFGVTYHLTGSEVVTAQEIAGLYGQVSGKLIKYNRISNEEYLAKSVERGMSNFHAEESVEHWNLINERRNEEVSGDVLKLTGRFPLSLEEFLIQKAATL